MSAPIRCSAIIFASAWGRRRRMTNCSRRCARYLEGGNSRATANGDTMTTRNAKARAAEIRRKTKETDIRVSLALDGRGTARISTGLPFLDHMLALFAKHGLFDIE